MKPTNSTPSDSTSAEKMISPITRRDMLRRSGCGFGALALTALLANDPASASDSTAGTETDPLAAKKPHFTARAKRVIFLFMPGGP
jgi:hypothetical protein